MDNNLKNKHLTEIPFIGFYESEYSDSIFEYILTSISLDKYELYPDELEKAELDKVVEKSQLVHYKTWQELCQKVVENYADRFKREYELLSLEFDSLEMPKEYNFENDRIFITCESWEILDLWKKCDKLAFSDYVKERLKPSSGWSPYYDNDLSEWLPNILEWEQPQLSLLFEFLFETLEYEPCELGSVILEFK